MKTFIAYSLDSTLLKKYDRFRYIAFFSRVTFYKEAKKLTVCLKRYKSASRGAKKRNQ